MVPQGYCHCQQLLLWHYACGYSHTGHGLPFFMDVALGACLGY